jgi:hypothetical protein
MVNLIASLSIRRCPSEFVNVACRNIVILAFRFFNVAKFTTLTPSSLLISCKLSFPCVGLKNFFPSYFGIKISYQNFRLLFGEFIEYTF